MEGYLWWRLPRWGSGKESFCQYRRHKRCGFDVGWEDLSEEGMVTPSSILAMENSVDKGAWQATVYGVAKSQKWLNDWVHGIFLWDKCKRTDLESFMFFLRWPPWRVMGLQWKKHFYGANQQKPTWRVKRHPEENCISWGLGVVRESTKVPTRDGVSFLTCREPT